MNRYLSKTGTVALIILLILILIGVILGRDALSSMGDGSRRAIKEAREGASAFGQAASERAKRAREAEEGVYDDDLPRYARKKRGIGYGLGSDNTDNDESADNKDKKIPRINGEELPEIDKTPRINKKVSGVMTDVRVGDDSSHKGKSTFDRDDIHEITVKDISDADVTTEKAHAVSRSPYDLEEAA